MRVTANSCPQQKQACIHISLMFLIPKAAGQGTAHSENLQEFIGGTLDDYFRKENDNINFL